MWEQHRPIQQCPAEAHVQPQQTPSRPWRGKHQTDPTKPQKRSSQSRENCGVQSQSFSKYYMDGSDLKVHTRTQLMLVTERMRNTCREDKTAHVSTPYDILLLHSLAYFKQNATSEKKKCLAHKQQTKRICCTKY